MQAYIYRRICRHTSSNFEVLSNVVCRLLSLQLVVVVVICRMCVRYRIFNILVVQAQFTSILVCVIVSLVFSIVTVDLSIMVS